MLEKDPTNTVIKSVIESKTPIRGKRIKGQQQRMTTIILYHIEDGGSHHNIRKRLTVLDIVASRLQ